jgi:hypothetical protein
VQSLTDPAFVSIGSYEVFDSRDYPAAWEHYCRRAGLIEDNADGDGARLVVGIRAEPRTDPQLLVATRYAPSVGGFAPGVLLVPETDTAWIGAGTKLLAYRLGTAPSRLWVDTAEVGFWSWRRHGSTILMSAELELVAWDLDGNKLWTRPVEPPWSYTVADDQVTLDVIGNAVRFGLREAPNGN